MYRKRALGEDFFQRLMDSKVNKMIEEERREVVAIHVLYFDGHCIPMRSNAVRGILKALAVA